MVAMWLPSKIGPHKAAVRSFVHALWGDPVLRRLGAGVAIVNGLAIAVGLIALAFHKIGGLPRDQVKWLYVTHDGSPVEWAGYIEMALAAMFLFLSARRERIWLPGAVAAFVALLGLDDFFMVHDTARIMFGKMIGFDSAWLVSEDLGELLYASLAGLALLPFAWFVARRTGRGQLMRCAPVMAAIAMLLGFAIGLDLIHQILNNAIGLNHPVSLLTGIAEDSFELISMGLICIFAVAQWRTAGTWPNP